MSEYRRKSPPRNYLARREQWRLLGLVLALGLIVILMSEARNPANYRWMFGGDQDEGTSEVETTKHDNRYEPPPRRPEVPGTFIARAEPDEAEADTTGRYFPGVKPDFLEKVRDDAPFGSAVSAEHRAWLNLLEILHTADEETLSNASTGRATYAQLMKQAGEYRGKLVTVFGTVHRAHRLEVPENDAGVETYYRIWISPDDNPASPLVAYVLELPEGFPTGMDVRADVRLVGFSFKRWLYLAGDPATGEETMRIAPLLFARTLHWRKPVPSRPPPSADPITLATIAGVALLVAVVVVVYALRRGAGETVSRQEELPEELELGWDAGPPSEAGVPLDDAPKPESPE
jgi:hypothetical protein